MNKKTANKVRLPDGVFPTHYDLVIHPDLDGFLFKGDERIKLTITKPQAQLVLHSKDLLIDADKVVLSAAKQKCVVKKISFNEHLETVTFDFGQKIQPGSYELELFFEGQLANNMRGFYRSGYTHKGKDQWLATTQFESTDARRAFPSFDEPAQKAVFDVSLVIPKHLSAISNTVVTEVAEHASGYKVVRFSSTPKMSTYLLAFIVGDFESIEGKTKDGVVVKIYTTPGKKNQGKFALDCAIKTIEYFNTYFGIKYPLPSMDMIAIPDFAAGAMENWGAVTYRESQLLVDEENSSSHTKQWVALTVAHELAHQWFGNLVTMEWWTHLWLNEGFASYIEYVAVDHIFPKWHIWDQFVTIDFNAALELDALQNTHPVEVEVHHPSEIGEIFDGVSYHKGASIIRMLADYLGYEVFRKGLHHYLKTHSYANASTVDLWKAFEKVSKKPVTKMMHIWTSKSGFPRIQVIDSGSNLKLHQQRFFASSVEQKKHKDTTVWQVPMRMELSNGKQETILLNKKTQVIKKPSNIAWVKLNAGETSFVHIDYPQTMLLNLKQAIASKKISAVDRLGIVRDAFAVSQNGNLPLTVALECISSYKNEREYIVVSELIERMVDVARIFNQETFYPKLEMYFRDLLVPLTDHVGFKPVKGENHTEALMRPLVLSASGRFGNATVIAWAKKMFKAGRIPADLKACVYNIVARNGGVGEYKKFVKMYETAESNEEKNRIGRALGAFQNKELIKQTLAFSISDKVRIQDTPIVLWGLWASSIARPAAWEFTKKNLKFFVDRYGEGGHTFSRIISPIGLFTDKKYAIEVKKFFSTHAAPGAERTVAQAIEQIESADAWNKREKKHLAKFLK